MKIFYTAFLSEDEKTTDQLASKTIPDLLLTYANDGDKLVCHFEGDSLSKGSSTQDILSDLRSADAFVSEVSHQNTALGFELAYANLHFIPTLYLYHSNAADRPSPLITQNPSRKVWVREYTEDTLDQVIKKFIKMVERQMETARTSFMSTREIDDYLSRTSDAKGIPKGELIRQALSDAARRGDETSV